MQIIAMKEGLYMSKDSTPTGLVLDSNMVAVLLF